MERLTLNECALQLFNAVDLFIHHSAQRYIERKMIEAHEKPALMRELWGQLEQSALENNRTFNNKATASACFTFE
ncbi:hypothetical protein MY816_02900 [Haemophilus influenzae]|nr:hypothetical protein [Haemophilus influenzae]MCK8927728.1 hypothetical protein [Haemophilus influenzae]MCK8953457.1 hypothetical protein [Haemophilus influenzae]